MSPNRDDANRTLAAVESVIRRRFHNEQASNRRDDRWGLATIARHNA
jgi:hypothetical protein